MQPPFRSAPSLRALLRTVLPALALTLTGPAPAAAQRDIAEFHALADSVTRHPPFRSELTTLCQVKVQERWVSFVGYRSTRTVLYVTFTLDSLADPVADVSPVVTFVEARPSLGKVSTWGYPFDRNRDGVIDYVALVGGAAPFRDGDFPPNYPKLNEQMMMHHVELYVNKCRIVFNHWADDNYDGMLDAVAVADMDPERTWVNRQILARSRKFDGRFDEVLAFRADTSWFPDTVSFGPDRFSHRPLGAPAGSFGWAEMDAKSAVMALMNEAVEACGKGAFRLSSGKIDDPVLE